MLKKLIFAVALLTVIFSLFACGGVKDDTTADGVTEVTEPSGDDTDIPTVSEFVETDENHVHSYFEAIVEATCTSIGMRAEICECGDIKETLEYLPMKEHNGNQASCGVDSVCSVCGKVLIEKYDHVIKYTTVSEVTCTTDGVKTAVCERCGYSDEIVTPASHSYTKFLVEGEKASAVCSLCGDKDTEISVVQIHNDDTCKIVGAKYANGSFSIGTAQYRFPDAIKGSDKSPYQMDFTLTLDSILDATKLVNGINGRNLLRYNGTSNSIFRAFPVDDGNGGCLSDVIEIGTLSNINVSFEKFIKMKVGESIKISLYVKPDYGTVDIYINDSFVAHRAYDTTPFTETQETLFFGYDNNTSFTASISEISIIRAK